MKRELINVMYSIMLYSRREIPNARETHFSNMMDESKMSGDASK